MTRFEYKLFPTTKSEFTIIKSWLVLFACIECIFIAPAAFTISDTPQQTEAAVILIIALPTLILGSLFIYTAQKYRKLPLSSRSAMEAVRPSIEAYNFIHRDEDNDHSFTDMSDEENRFIDEIKSMGTK